jgi:hypothetical protein
MAVLYYPKKTAPLDMPIYKKMPFILMTEMMPFLTTMILFYSTQKDLIVGK